MSDEKKDEFGDRLWDAWLALVKRKKGKIAQAQVAARIRELSGQKTRQDDISRWLRGKGRPSYEELPALGKVLGVRHYWLAFNEGPMVKSAKEGGEALTAHDRLTGGEHRDEKRRGA